jgi:hypothetical protein
MKARTSRCKMDDRKEKRRNEEGESISGQPEHLFPGAKFESAAARYRGFRDGLGGGGPRCLASLSEP